MDTYGSGQRQVQGSCEVSELLLSMQCWEFVD